MIHGFDFKKSKLGTPKKISPAKSLSFSFLAEAHSQQDIIKSANAFTGYSEKQGVQKFAPAQHDKCLKTIFGETGLFGGDDVVNLACTRPAGRFLLHEMGKF